MNFGLPPDIIDKIRVTLAQFTAIDEAVVYGSRAKGTAKPGSDIDLALKGAGLDVHTLNQISLALDDLLLPWTFDVSIYEAIDNTDLRLHIERVGKTLYLDSSKNGG